MRRLLAALALTTAVAAPTAASADVPEPFHLPAMSDDYRVGYSLEGGIWTEGQGTLHHRLRLQIPLWGTAAGATLPFGNALGEVNDSVLGNLVLYAQWFRRFAIAPRTAVRIGGGLDVYAPTATPLEPQEAEAALLSGPAAAESALFAPGLTVALRPRVHLGGELWIFSLQMAAGAAVHFEGSHAAVAIDWGANFSAWITDWVAISAEAAGVSWVHEAPEWMSQRVVTLGGGLRFHLPYGWRPGLWVRTPVTDPLTDFGYGTFVGVEIIWRHDRNWFLF